MDSKQSVEDIGSVDLPEARSECLKSVVGEKRPVENGEDDELGAPSAKKARNGSGSVGNVRKVAETVLVLAAMGKMRGGRSPTAAEKVMMADARKKLAEVCEEFSPKDIFPRDAFGAIMEDLGLNRLREQRLGFRPPKMSIAEKLLFTKKKMEKLEEFSVRAATHSSHRMQTSLGAAAESRGTSHGRTFPSDKAGHAPISSGVLQPSSALGHVSTANSTSLPYQLPTSEVRVPMVSSGLPTSLLGKDSSSLTLPRVDKPYLRLDPRSNGSSYGSQVQVNSSSNHALLKTPAGPQQSQTDSSGSTGPDNKVLLHHSVNVEGTTADTTASRTAPQVATSTPLITQTASGHLPTMHQHVQGINFIQAPLLNNVHGEIGKIVQKLLQPRLPEHPTWTPPSRDYMNKTLTCQICKLTINEVENVLICDACEKGYHLKCLQSHNQKAVPRGEWHCFKCLSLSNGKPLPPKYGRVTRNISAPKVPSNASILQSPPEKKVGAIGEKGNQQKIIANGGSGFQSFSAGSMGNNHSTSTSNMPSVRELKGNDILSDREKLGDKCHFETCQNDAIRNSGPASVSSAADSSVDRSCEEPVCELKGHSSSKPLETGPNVMDYSKASSTPQDSGPQGLPNGATFDGNPNDDIEKEEQGVVRVEPVNISRSIPTSAHTKSSDGSNNVNWIGDILQVVGEKTYYKSCFINGVVYKVQDHVLFRSNNDKLMPSKLQAMWEDNKTRSKWAVINLCYFPVDLPEAVGRPCSPESNEVYESNHGSTIMAGLIQGPCEVLPPGKFIEEIQRRSRLGTGANGGLRPLFLCKWFYDAKKGVFRDVSC